MRTPHLRRADTRPDSQARSADRATALDAGLGRSRPGGPGRRPAELCARGLRQPEHRPAPGRRPSRARGARPACRHPDTLTETERLQLKAVRTHCSKLDALTGHVRSFATMLTERQGERLPDWLDAVRQDDLPSLHTLAAGLDRDRDAVIAGLTLPWSSGAVEGHVNRIKMLKRQMFGRAGFTFLRKRVLMS
ncbi:transposase [Streptomyces sparsogenes]|uniref:transposase n=1 Tax=Streptomyces sparsogenes TaxID=67365 RepID=UPI0033CA7F8C